MGKDEMELEKSGAGDLRSSFFTSALFYNFQSVIHLHVLLKVS